MQSQQFELHFIEYINSAIKTLKVQPLLLNGRPGGYIGQLAQSKVSYDAVESESNAVPASRPVSTELIVQSSFLSGCCD